MAPQTLEEILSLPDGNQLVKLNVGGTRYEAPWTLISSSPKLSTLEYERWVEDPEAEIFVDCNGTRFEYCLDYLR